MLRKKKKKEQQKNLNHLSFSSFLQEDPLNFLILRRGEFATCICFFFFFFGSLNSSGEGGVAMNYGIELVRTPFQFYEI